MVITCPLCKNKYNELSDLYLHLEEEHGELIPSDYTTPQYYYYLKTGKTHGTCVMCKKDTKWNPKTNKYNRFCDNPKCKEKYKEIFRERMIGKYGKTTLLNEPEHQKKMLANRKISGTYKWSDGGESTYTGSYELDFLKMLDILMNFSSKDVMSPSPHTYWYTYENKKHFYMPDFFIPSLNLEIEIKDGRGNMNHHHKIQDVDKVKEKLKDDILKSQNVFSYIKILNKEYDNFFKFLYTAKNNFIEGNKDKVIFITESAEFPHLYREQVPLSTFKSINMNQRVISKYESKCHSLKHVNIGNNIVGELFIDDNDDIVGYMTIDTSKNCILYLEVSNKYRYKGLGNDLLLLAKSKYHIKHTHVNKNNDLAMRMYKRNGFKVVEEDDNILYMSCENVIYCKNISKYNTVCEESSSTKDTHHTELIPVYILLTYTGSLMAKGIKHVTHQPYSHAGISFSENMTDIFTYGRKDIKDKCKFTIENITSGVLGSFSDTISYSLYVTFFPKPNFKALKQRIKNIQSDISRHGYSYKGLINFALGRETHDDYRMFCSQFVADVLKAGDPNRIKRHTSLYSPYDLKSIKGMYFVTKGKLSNYKPSKVKDIVNRLKDSTNIEKCIPVIESCFNVDTELVELYKNNDIVSFSQTLQTKDNIWKLENTLSKIDDMYFRNKLIKTIDNLYLEYCIENAKPDINSITISFIVDNKKQTNDTIHVNNNVITHIARYEYDDNIVKEVPHIIYPNNKTDSNMLLDTINNMSQFKCVSINIDIPEYYNIDDILEKIKSININKCYHNRYINISDKEKIKKSLQDIYNDVLFTEIGIEDYNISIKLHKSKK